MGIIGIDANYLIMTNTNTTTGISINIRIQNDVVISSPTARTFAPTCRQTWPSGRKLREYSQRRV